MNNLHTAQMTPVSVELLFCVNCEWPLGEHRVSEAKGIIVKCSHCGTLQHHRVGLLHG